MQESVATPSRPWTWSNKCEWHLGLCLPRNEWLDGASRLCQIQETFFQEHYDLVRTAPLMYINKDFRIDATDEDQCTDFVFQPSVLRRSVDIVSRSPIVNSLTVAVNVEVDSKFPAPKPRS